MFWRLCAKITMQGYGAHFAMTMKVRRVLLDYQDPSVLAKFGAKRGKEQSASSRLSGVP